MSRSRNAGPCLLSLIFFPATADLMVAVVVAFGAGIAWARILSGGPEPFLGLAIALLAAGSLTARHCCAQAVARFLLLPLFFLLGSLHAFPALQPPAAPDHLLNRAPSGLEVVLTGILIEAPAVTPEKTRLLMRVEEVRRPAGSVAAEGLVRLTLAGRPPPDLQAGDRFLARTVLSAVDNYANPGSFDYRTYLTHQAIHLTGWIQSPSHLLELHDSEPSPWSHRLRYAPERLRQRLGNFLAANLDQPERGIYQALLLGDRSQVQPEILEQFKASGTMHLLAISGLHMGLLALLTGLLLNGLLKRSAWMLLHLPAGKIAAVLTLLPLTGYALVAGFQTPVVRALLMIGVFLLAVLFDRQRSTATTIGLAAFLILLYQPTSLFTVSFQLSFAAVIGMAVVYHRLAARLEKRDPSLPAWHPKHWHLWALAGMAASVAALLGTLPLLLYYFHRVALLSPLATLAVEPFLCGWGLIFGLPACLLHEVWPWLATGLLQAGSLGITVATRLTGELADLPFASLWLTTPTIPEIGAYYLLLAGLLYRRQRFGKVLIFTCLTVLLVIPAYARLARSDRVTFLDVGQGNAAVLELAGKSILIDGGGYRSESFDPGEQLIAPYLWQRRISDLEAVVVTHPHADHYNGLFFLIREFGPKTLWINGQEDADPWYRSLLALARAQGVEIRTPKAGSLLFEAKGGRLECLADPPATGSTNDRSLLLGLEMEGFRFLLPGDAEPEVLTERLLPAAERTEVLLAPHHGHHLTTRTPLLTGLAPRFLVVSAGRRQLEGYGSGEDPAEWHQAGITVLTTSELGAISFKPENGTLAVRTGKEQRVWQPAWSLSEHGH